MQTKDSTAEMAEYIGQAIDETFAALIERRDSQYAAAIAPLDAERESLSQEHAAIGEAAQNLAELLPAKARVAQAEHDRLLLAGDREGAAVKLAEQKEAEHAAEAMRARQREIFNRLEAITEREARHSKAHLRGMVSGLPESHPAYRARPFRGDPRRLAKVVL